MATSLLIILEFDKKFQVIDSVDIDNNVVQYGPLN
jgi:hypothetical protein